MINSDFLLIRYKLGSTSDLNELITFGIFLLVYFLIIARVRLNNLPFWIIMSIGSILVLGFGIIPIEYALKSINFQVIVFLFGMFSITPALERSGVLNYVVGSVLLRIKKADHPYFNKVSSTINSEILFEDCYKN